MPGGLQNGSLKGRRLEFQQPCNHATVIFLLIFQYIKLLLITDTNIPFYGFNATCYQLWLTNKL